mgnify:CR=1 FL=1
MEDKKIIYKVTIKISYYVAVFEFDSIEEAGEFIKTAVSHNVKGENDVTISMTIKEPEEERAEEETE